MLSRITLIMGIAPPTEASKRNCASACFAVSKMDAPRLARSCLLAVTTLFPALSAPSTKPWAGSTPPINSTTMSREGSPLISLKSSVKRSCGTPGRSMLRSLSSMRATWSSTPVASSISALCSWIKSYTLDPTVPNPKRPIRTTLCTPPSILPDTPSDTNYESSGQRSLLGYEVIICLALNHHLGLSVLHQQDTRPRVTIIVGSHGITVAASGRCDQDITHLGSGYFRILDQDIPALTVLPGHRHRRIWPHLRLIGQHGFVLGPVEHGADVVAHSAINAHECANVRYFLDGAHAISGQPRLPDDGPSRLHQ